MSYITFFEKSMFKVWFCHRCQTVGFNGEQGLCPNSSCNVWRFYFSPCDIWAFGILTFGDFGGGDKPKKIELPKNK